MSGIFVQMTGMSGAGKSTMTFKAASILREMGHNVEVIDGDEYRMGLCSDLGFSKEDRNTNIRRLSFVGKVLSRNDVICIMSAINPYDDIRQEVVQNNELAKTVYVKCDMDTLIDRDPKGLYARALLPSSDPNHIPNFTGISDPFEEPANADLTINTAGESIDTSVDTLIKFILENVGEGR
jgi:adenylylsulfate kinase